MYNNEQKLKLHKVAWIRRDTTEAMASCNCATCTAQCQSPYTIEDQVTGTNVVTANIYRITNGMV